MTNLANLAAVLFDMDGTLVDSTAAVERAWTVWAAEHGVDPAAALAIAHGASATRTVRQLLPGLHADAVAVSASRQLELQYDDLSDVVPVAGAHDLIAVVEGLGMSWAVVTGADVRLARARLRAVEISPPLLVTADDVSVGKPDPEGFLRAAALLAVQPRECLVVEDSADGVAAGRAAGMKVAAVGDQEGDLRPGLDHLAGLLRRAHDA